MITFRWILCIFGQHEWELEGQRGNQWYQCKHCPAYIDPLDFDNDE